MRQEQVAGDKRQETTKIQETRERDKRQETGDKSTVRYKRQETREGGQRQETRNRRQSYT